MKLRDPGHDVVVLERNPAGVTCGGGIVFWDDLLEGLRANDPPTADAIGAAAFRWVDQHVVVDGQLAASLAGCGFSVRRQRLLDILTARALELGVDVRFEAEVEDPGSLDADLVVACDGVNSRLRRRDPDRFGTRIDTGRNKYMWLCTTRVFDAFTFAFVRTEAGWIWCHAYGFNATTSTFIVECSPETWAGLGFGQLGLEQSVARLEDLFARQLDGHRLVAQVLDPDRAHWLAFRTVTNQRWRRGNLVLAGDAAHTTHFTIGSGTKLAIEDAIGLASALGAYDELGPALAAYERERKAALVPLQLEARNSARWFEHLPRYIDLGAPQFAALLDQRRSRLLRRMSPSGYYRLRRTTEEFALFDRLWHWASSQRRWRS
jgi:anthraniloyl-CoA monooxygenase